MSCAYCLFEASDSGRVTLEGPTNVTKVSLDSYENTTQRTFLVAQDKGEGDMALNGAQQSVELDFPADSAASSLLSWYP